MRNKCFVGLTALGLVAAMPGAAQVDFDEVAITQPVTITQVQSAAGAASSNGLAGVALGPGSDVFVVHLNALNEETFLRLDPATATSSFSITGGAVRTSLGAPFTSVPAFPILTGEFLFDPNRGAQGTLYFADESIDQGDDVNAIIAVNVAGASASAVVTSDSIAGVNSFGLLPNGKLVVALGEDHETLTGNEPSLGLIDPDDATPEYEEVFDMEDFAGAAGLPLSTELPPDAVGVNPSTGRVWTFIHDELLLFRSDDFDTSPTLDWEDITDWNGAVDLHGVAVDEDDNVYGYDEGAEALVVYNGTDTYELTFDDIRIALGGTNPFTPVLWRGMKARKISATQSEVWLASSNADYGLVRVVFGTDTSGVADYHLYD